VSDAACSPLLEQERAGLVWFVGAGPGDPELLTLKAQRLIAAADVIVYAGSLVNPAVLAHARPHAELHDSAGMKLVEQIEVMRSAVAHGRTVVRLHTGDPAIYGAILEQIRELEKHGVPYAIIPGVSSAFAAAAALGIEFSVPGDTQTVMFTRLAGRTPVPEREALHDLAAHRTSLVVFLSAGMIARVVDELRAAGYDSDTPIAVVFRASWPDELILRGTLDDIAGQVEEAAINNHALIVVSPALRPEAKAEAAPVSHLYGAGQAIPPRQPTTAIVALSRGSADLGRRLHGLLPGSVLYTPARFLAAGERDQPGIIAYETSVRQVLQSAFQEHHALVAVMAAGIVIRDLAPVLRSKHADPAVVVLDERGQHAISLLSGHQGGANDLARRVAGLLGGTPVLTTASDVRGLPALDLLGRDEGWVLTRGEQLTEVTAAVVNGETVGVVQEAGDESWWPALPAENLIRFGSMAELTASAPSAAVIVTYRSVPAETSASCPRSIVYHVPCLAVGVGCNRGTAAQEIRAAILQVLEQEGLDPRSVRGVATIEDKADEAGLLQACQDLGWPLRVFSRREIASVEDLPTPSPAAERALGVRGVAEPAALLAAGPGAALLVTKRKIGNVTVAVAIAAPAPRVGAALCGCPSTDAAPPGGHVAIVGIGPGGPAQITPAARDAIEQADVILGYHLYQRLIDSLAPGVPRETTGMRQEVARANRAVDLARAGRRVAVISGGDAGIYGMAGVVYEVLRERGQQSDGSVTVEVIPGISALNAAAALLGAPLMTDFAAISLSDQLVSREEILGRVEWAAQADFVLCLYNPVGQKRVEPFRLACDILLRCRPPDTPVGIVRAAYRPEQRIEIVPLSALADADVDMVTVIIVGNSTTYVHDGKMVTPRGYGRKYDLAASQT
jgi:cobalt-precorrin 5A hydrolase / precorrin-3B C17-methyltransferase